MCCIATIIKHHVWLPALGTNTFFNTPPKVLFTFTSPRKYTNRIFGKCCCYLVLRGIYVTCSPSDLKLQFTIYNFSFIISKKSSVLKYNSVLYLSSKSDKCFNQNCCLSIDVGTTNNFSPIERFIILKFEGDNNINSVFI